MFNRVALPVLSALTLAPLVTIAQPSIVAAQAAPASVTSVLPDNTAAVFTVNTSAQDWEALKQYQLFPEVTALIQMALAFAPPDFQIQPAWYQELAEIQGWLGDRAAVALLSPQVEQRDKMDANFVMVLPVKDRDRFTAYLTKLKPMLVEKTTEREYNGVPILEWTLSTPEITPDPNPTEPPEAAPSPQTRSLSQSPLALLPRLKVVKPSLDPSTQPGSSGDTPTDESSRSKLVVAILPDALVISDQATPIQRLIDRQQPDLTQNPRFQRTLNNPQYQRSLLTFYLNLEEAVKFADFLPDQAEEDSGESDPSESEADSTDEPEATAAPELAPPPATATSVPQPEAATPAEAANDEAEEEAEEEEAEENEQEPDVPTMPSPLPTQQEVEANLKRLTDAYSTFDALVWTQPEGIRVQSNTYYQKPKDPDLLSTVPNDRQIFKRLPAISYLVANGYSLKHQWELIVEALSQDPELKDGLREIRNAARLYVGLDIDRDLAPWMDGNYAVFYFPSRRSVLSEIESSFQLGLGLLIETSNRAAAEVALERLNRSMRVKSNGELTVSTRMVQGTTVTSWDVKDGQTTQSLLAYTWLDDTTLIITTGTGSIADLAPKPYLALVDNYTFQTATDGLPRPNQGYLYFNMGASLAFIYGLFPYDDYPGVKEFKQVIGTIQSLSATSLITPEKEQVDSLFVLAPVRKPVAPAKE